MTDPEAKEIIQRIAKSTQSAKYMIAQVSQFQLINKNVPRYMILKWIREVNPKLADSINTWQVIG